MRNGTTAVAEDRGTAILSTMPLADLQAIELPFERQRRVALAATVGGATPSGEAWRLRLAAVHMDTSLAFTRGGPVVARRRQAEALVEALGLDAAPNLTGSAGIPTVLGGDFNTWLGPKESALDVLRRAFPETPRAGNASTWRGPLGAHAALDHVFVRGQFRSVTTRRLPGRFGSDHYPLLTVVGF
jgi:endonuclease/exonuclease/phosphatase family metal-dependent hydrolase